MARGFEQSGRIQRVPLRVWLLAAVAVVGIQAVAVLAMGRVPICTCGYVKLWHGVTFSAENSQHITDWYTPSHVIHGFLFYALTWLIGRRWPVGLRLVLALLLEGAWELLENTDAVIDRYRAATIALDYYGDSVLNSVSDVLACAFGFWLARRLPTGVTVALTIVMELVVGYLIRDNLTLNVIMLVHPVEWIKTWQGGG